MKTKEEIIQALRGSKIVMENTGNPRNAEYIQHTIDYIESLNPNRIDEERMEEIFKNQYDQNIFEKSSVRFCIEQYNSTIPEIKELEPLHDEDKLTGELLALNIINNGSSLNEISKTTAKYLLSKYGTPKSNLQPLLNVSDFGDEIYDLGWTELTPDDCRKLAKSLIRKYGTSKREDLPSVESLAIEIRKVVDDTRFKEGEESVMNVAQHLIDKYSLPKREEPKTWWEKAIPNETQFVCDGSVYVFTDYYVETHGRKVWINSNKLGHLESNCTPYIEANTREKLLATMTDEQKELLKQLEAERC